MATATDVSDKDINEVIEKLKKCAQIAKGTGAKDEPKFNIKALGIMTKEAKFSKKCTTGFGIAHSSATATSKAGKGNLNLNDKKEVDVFLNKCGAELAADKLDKKSHTVTDEEKREYKIKFCEIIKKTEFKVEDKTKATNKTASAATDRLTDTKKYTGAHKERFDAEGKGKGADGRTDKADNSGYVGNYKGAGTYDAKK